MNSRLTPLPQTCAFCGDTDLTREHVWADWLKAYLPSLINGVSNHAVAGGGAMPKAASDTSRRWEGGYGEGGARCLAFSRWCARIAIMAG